jgi:cobalt-zinc-cadmium resistance protein CzcA
MLVTDVAPVMTFNLDADAAGRHGLTRTDIADVITAAIGGRETGIIYEGDRRFSLVIRLPETLRQNLEALRRLPVPMPRKDGVDALPAKYTTAGAVLAGGSRPAALPLETFAKIEIIEGPTEIQRQNGHRHVQVTCNVQGRDLGSFVAEAQALVDQQVELPKGKGYRIEWGGQFENLLAARQRLQFVVPACFFLIFVLLFTTFNSVRDALIVFSGVPLALTGGIVALWLRGIDFSISAGVGFIALSGVAVLNGLVMVTFIKQLRNEGLPLEEAIIKGSLTRLRPVLMTALVASLGFVPMALATGPGAEVQKPLATVVIGGVISSTLLTLVVLPALYRLGHRIKGTPRRVHPVPEEALPVA